LDNVFEEVFDAEKTHEHGFVVIIGFFKGELMDFDRDYFDEFDEGFVG
jgi:hypothetical protein